MVNHKRSTEISFRLHRIKCLLNYDYQGDEIYVKYNGRKIWPEDRKWHRMRDGDEVLLNVSDSVENIGDKVDIELWESDFLSHNKIGSFVLLLNSLGGPFTVEMLKKNNKVKYSLIWEVLGT